MFTLTNLGGGRYSDATEFRAGLDRLVAAAASVSA